MLQDTTTLAPLLWLVGCQLGLYAIGWAVVGALLGEDRDAVTHWGVFLLLCSIVLLLAAGRGEPRHWWAYSGVDVVTLIGFAAMRRGTERFLRIASSDREQIVMLVLVGGTMALLGPGEEAAPWRIVLAYGGQGYVMGRMMWRARTAMRAEFGTAAYRAVVIPGALIAVLLLLLALRQLVAMGEPQEMQRPEGSNVALMYLYLFGCALFNFGFTVLVTQRLVLKWRRASRQDSLTGLFNRGAIEAELHRHWRDAGANPLALMLIDVDHFKRVNDMHGHAAGDRVLAQVAQRIGALAGAAAPVGRYGGEEFLVLMPGAGRAAGLHLAECLRAAVAAEPIALRGEALPITLSIGVAQRRRDDASPEAALARADEALYRAKASGRNRVEPEAAGPAAPAFSVAA